MLWGLRYVDEYVRAMVWKRYCEIYSVKKRYCAKDVKSKTLWERRKKNNMLMYIGKGYDNVGRMVLWGKHSDNDVMQIKLWALRCANDDVRKKIVRQALWETRWDRHCEKEGLKKTL